MAKKIIIGSDHAGFQLKEILKQYLIDKNFEVKDCGTYSEASVDYPDFAHKVANGVASQEAQLGVLLCGSANGVAITANKHNNIRAAIAWTAEISKLARSHNDANIICIPARFISEQTAFEIIDEFTTQNFEGGRHQARVDKINC